MSELILFIQRRTDYWVPISDSKERDFEATKVKLATMGIAWRVLTNRQAIEAMYEQGEWSDE